jgi:hypothetical protein
VPIGPGPHLLSPLPGHLKFEISTITFRPDRQGLKLDASDFAITTRLVVLTMLEAGRTLSRDRRGVGMRWRLPSRLPPPQTLQAPDKIFDGLCADAGGAYLFFKSNKDL